MAKKSKEINICPNCGWKIQGPEHLPSVAVLTQQVGLDYDPVAGRFICPKCNFSGLPILVKEEDYNKIKFKNKEYAPPLGRANPNYYRMLILGIAMLFIGSFFVSLLGGSQLLLILWAIASFIVLFYATLRIKKYRKTEFSK